MPTMRSSWALAIILVAAACGDDGHAAVDAAPNDGVSDQLDAPLDADPLHPPTLADTGLCTNAACTAYAADVHSYIPQYQLWSDGASKKRWISLPPGTKIDTTEMNFWKFPVGTRLWTEFTRDGVRVETRYMLKIKADDSLVGSWFFAAYGWNGTQDATVEVTPAGMMNANGTGHDIPTRSDCRRCHENTPGRVLGFQAMSLDYAAPAGEWDLDDVAGMNLLTTAPAGATTPHYSVPGTAVDKAAFGYMHANCGGCHNPHSSIFATTALELRMDVNKLGTVNVMPAHVTTVNVNGTVGGLTGPIVKPNDPTNSVIIIRTTATTNPPKMPEKGTEIVDPAGQTALVNWINQPP
ncbi:hypothetical protein BH11MYX3_BH11MYX3_43550 [soil metagenome]